MANAMTNDNYGKIAAVLDSPTSKQRLSELIGRDANIDQVVAWSKLAIRNNPGLLMSCANNLGSIFLAVAEVVKCGLQFGPPYHHAYLVPYGGECTAQLGYRGMIELARRTGQIRTFKCATVHVGDQFEFTDGDEARLLHVPSSDKDRERATITHVYVIFYLTDGTIVRNVWDAARINSHRDQYSQGFRRAEDNGKRDSPWHTAWRQQAYKTLIRDLWNRAILPAPSVATQMIITDTAVELERPVVRQAETRHLASELSQLFAPESDSETDSE